MLQWSVDNLDTQLLVTLLLLLLLLMFLLYIQGAESFRYAYFGSGTGTIAYSNVYCTGREFRLVDCSKSTAPSYCGHYYDAGVRCQPKIG